MGIKAVGVTLAAIVFVACGSQQQLVGTNPAPQFRDLTFGQAPTSDMVPARSDSGLLCFTRPSDDMSAGYGKLSSLKYCFYDSQLLAVIVETKGLQNSQALLETLRAKYGQGSQPNQFMPEYMWGLYFSPLVIVYDQNSITDDASVTYQSKAVQAKMQAAQGKATSNAASQF